MRGVNGVGQDLVTGASSIYQQGGIGDSSWPYWWLIPRKNTQYVQRVASIVLPAAGVLTEVVEVAVPIGFRFILRAIRQTFAGDGTFIDGSGGLLWTIDVDNPIGATQLTSYGLPDLTNMADERGSQLGPWPIEGYTVFDQYQVVRYKVTSSLGFAGGDNFITCGLFGWFDKIGQ